MHENINAHTYIFLIIIIKIKTFFHKSMRGQYQKDIGMRIYCPPLGGNKYMYMYLKKYIYIRHRKGAFMRLCKKHCSYCLLWGAIRMRMNMNKIYLLPPRWGGNKADEKIFLLPPVGGQ